MTFLLKFRINSTILNKKFHRNYIEYFNGISVDYCSNFMGISWEMSWNFHKISHKTRDIPIKWCIPIPCKFHGDSMEMLTIIKTSLVNILTPDVTSPQQAKFRVVSTRVDIQHSKIIPIHCYWWALCLLAIISSLITDHSITYIFKDVY